MCQNWQPLRVRSRPSKFTVLSLVCAREATRAALPDGGHFFFVLSFELQGRRRRRWPAAPLALPIAQR
jgi:hypothetical protein